MFDIFFFLQLKMFDSFFDRALRYFYDSSFCWHGNGLVENDWYTGKDNSSQ